MNAAWTLFWDAWDAPWAAAPHHRTHARRLHAHDVPRDPPVAPPPPPPIPTGDPPVSDPPAPGQHPPVSDPPKAPVQ